MSKAPQGLEEVDGRACGPSFQSSVLGQVSSRPEDQCGPLSASSGFPWVFQVAWRTFSKRELNGADPKTDDECLIRTATMSPRRLFSFLLSWLPASCSTQPPATAVSNRLPTAGSLPSPQPFCRPAGPSRPLRLSPATVSPQLLPMPPRCSLPRWMQTAH